jgi:hypothetical protein
MADDASAENEADSIRPAPSVPKPPRASVLIEGEATESPERVGEPAAEAPPVTEPIAESPASAATEASSPIEPEPPAGKSAEPPPPPPPPPSRPGSAFGWGVSGSLIGAVVGAGLALGAAWLFAPWLEPMSELSARQSALETASSAQSAAVKAIEARLSTLEAAEADAAKATALDALETRVGKLEDSSVKPDALAAAVMDARAAHDAATKALALASARPAATSASTSAPPAPDPRVDKLVAETSALSERLAKLEAAPSPSTPQPAAPDPRVTELVADTSALSDQLTKLEAKLSAPKAETRVPVAAPPARDESAGQAIAAIALEQRLRSGQPFAVELAALTRLGADAGEIAALKPYADAGAPNAASLEASFAKVSPAILAAARPAQNSGGGALDKVLERVDSLVRVHPVGEIPGESPDALVSQVAAALHRGQVDAALTTFGRLPEACRKAAGDWPDAARAYEGAQGAARALRDGAIAHLAAAKN